MLELGAQFAGNLYCVHLAARSGCFGHRFLLHFAPTLDRGQVLHPLPTLCANLSGNLLWYCVYSSLESSEPTCPEVSLVALADV